MSTKQPHPPILVTRPHLPALERLVPFLEEIWDSRVLSNGGPLHKRLEAALAEYLGVEHIALFANATLALVAAQRALGVSGEVITTPYSFVATAHSVLWSGAEPVFVDIDPETLNLDPARIEAAITARTTAILPVHCYGRPCDVAAIQRIADAHGLQVIYDAAQAFGVRCDGGSVLRHGDLSVLSFHATKVFNTFEGGAIVCPDAKSKAWIDRFKNFGFVDEVTVAMLGLNGKMNELQAAVGLAQLPQVDAQIERRRRIDARYRAALAGVRGIRCLPAAPRTVGNHTSFPILVGDGYPISRDRLYATLKEQGVHGRRYFFPLITDFPMYRGLPSAAPDNLPVATRAARQVICLPIYPDLAPADVDRICDLIAGASKRAPARSVRASLFEVP